MSDAIKIAELAGFLNTLAIELGISNWDHGKTSRVLFVRFELGEVQERESLMIDTINSLNTYVIDNEPEMTNEFRLFVVEVVPRFLVAYQLLRFPVSDPSEEGRLPTNKSFTDFPPCVTGSGLYVPVSACLRLLAVCLVDEPAKRRMVECGNVKALVSHMVDDPLNPFQRESAIFAINVLTRDYDPAQRAISQLMSGKPS